MARPACAHAMRVGRPLPAGPRTLEFPVTVVTCRLGLERLAGGWVEEQFVEEQFLVPALVLVEVEHLGERAGDGVEGTADSRQLPVVFDELKDGGLVGQGVGHEVALGPGGDNQQGQPWPVAAAALLPGQRRIRGGVPAQPGAGEEVLRPRPAGDPGGVGRVVDAAEGVVVPAV